MNRWQQFELCWRERVTIDLPYVQLINEIDTDILRRNTERSIA